MLRVRDLIEELKKFPEYYPVVVYADFAPDANTFGKYIIDIEKRSAGFYTYPVVFLIPENNLLEIT